MQKMTWESNYVGSNMLSTLDAILMFFSINCFLNFHSHLLRHSTLIPHDKGPNLCILSQIPNSFAKIE